MIPAVTPTRSRPIENNNLPPSVISTEHRSAGKQPNTRYVNLSYHTSATPSTIQSGMEPRFRGNQTQPVTAGFLTPPQVTAEDPLKPRGKTISVDSTINPFNESGENTTNIHLVLHHNSTRNNLPPSVFSTEHQSAGKQPSFRYVNLFYPTFAFFAKISFFFLFLSFFFSYLCNTIYQPSGDAASLQR
jgi:hypothetical protein